MNNDSVDQQIYLVSNAIIFNDAGQILLAKRYSPESPSHDFWNLPGGGIEFGEDPAKTAVRETKEEVGVEIRLLSKHPFVYSYNSPNGDKHGLILAYPAQYVSGEIDVSQDEETSEAKWFTYEEIDFSKTLRFTKELVDDALEEFQTVK